MKAISQHAQDWPFAEFHPLSSPTPLICPPPLCLLLRVVLLESLLVSSADLASLTSSKLVVTSLDAKVRSLLDGPWSLRRHDKGTKRLVLRLPSTKLHHYYRTHPSVSEPREKTL